MVLNPLLNHDDLRRWRACSRRFWLYRRRDPAADSTDRKAPAADASAEAAVVHGPDADAALRASFPLADTIARPKTQAEWVQAMHHTLTCLDVEHMLVEGWAILGACLTSEDRAQVRIDVLTRGTRGLCLYKVRYATVGEDSDVDDVALWTHVAARCGLRIQSVGLLLVNTDFIYPGHGCYAGVFREVDLAPVLGSRPVAAWLTAMRDCARGSEPPATPGEHCTQGGGCEFAHSCQARTLPKRALLADPQASLEVVGRELAAELRVAGHVDLRSAAPASFENARHRRAVRAIQQGAPVLEPEAAALIQALPYPRHYLRFDTIGFAVPIWSGTRPYQVMPFQWTCDVQAADGQWQHHHFLADAQGGDPRRTFASTLLLALGSSGAVLAYNAGFEGNRIRELARQFDDLAPVLEAVLPRIVDLFQLARAHYYHPVMAGSWSFKSISRAVAPDLALGMEDPDGAGESSAQAAFSRSLQRGLDEATRQQLRAALHAHGQRETEVLCRLVMVLEGCSD
ncbi:DUF2779 domain-containing protein [Rhodoferax sp.]|uniref:DUF2779 domain-containing protein n=1 Tax=Rhodoferax sp. TaxID=50421 RepID=UPI00284549C1|nr:DUF2779 domain-containing protein [Rhodoferax sp.]MDR3369506.1 DUF2779 domain-containing protein [Rhodoferax sp.]